MQEAFVVIQRIDPTRGHSLLRVLLVFRIEAGGRRWHCPAHICEFLLKTLEVVCLINAILGWKFSLRGDSATTGLS